jgi:hypothetical protein
MSPELVGRHHIGVEPDGAAGGLAHLGAGTRGQQRRGQRVELRAAHAMAEIDAVDDVAPLVGAAHLQDGAVTAIELDEIIALHDHVVEFEEAQRLLAVEPELHRIEAQHAVDREMPADLAQEVDIVELQQPVGIVDHQRVGGAVAIAQHLGEDLPDAGDVGFDGLDREELSRLVLEGGIAHHRGAAAHQGDRPVPGLLHPVEHHDLDERAGMERGGGGVEADIAADRPRRRGGVEPLGIRDLMDEAALVEDVEEVGSVPGHRRRPQRPLPAAMSARRRSRYSAQRSVSSSILPS